MRPGGLFKAREIREGDDEDDHPAQRYLATPIRYVFANQGFAGELVGWA
jgi:hypothetical protein